MNDMIEAAQAAAPNTSAPIDTNPAPSQETSTQIETSSRGAVDRAFAALDKQEAPAPVEGEPAPARDDNRDELGRFKVQEGGEKPVEKIAEAVDPAKVEKPAASIDDAPGRFSPDAKAAWAQAPEAVRGEIKRAITELETGLTQYRERYEPIRQFAEMAEASGTTLDRALQNYVGAEQLLRSDPVQGMAHILQNIGLTPQQYAQHIMQTQGEAPDAQATMQDKIISDLQNQIAQMREQFGSINQTLEQQQMAQVSQMLDAFKETHPRFSELEPVIEKLITGNVAGTLDEAYSMADRLNPAANPVTPPPAPAATPVQPTVDPAHTRKGQLSISGAPSSGSNPSNRKAANSTRDAVNSAFAQLGIA